MTDVKISALPAAASFTSVAQVPAVIAGITTKATGLQIAAYVATTLTKSDVGLGNVDNTSDANKPVSTATQTALDLKANAGLITASGLTLATARLLGRTTAATGAVEEISIGSNLTLAAGSLNGNAGTVTAVSVASSNGFTGSSSGGATPSLTLTTSINAPALAGNGTAISAASTEGTGSTVVLKGSPTLTTPNIGVATATTVNKITITAPASGATLTIPDGLTLNAGPGGTLGTAAFKATGTSGNTVPLLDGANTFSATITGPDGSTWASTGISTASAKNITIGAGSNSVAPLIMTSGTVLTTASAGSHEFDGTAFYNNAVSSARQIVTTQQIQVLSSNRTFTNNTSAQAIFNASANGAITLAATTTYQFEMVVAATGFSGSSHTLQLGFALGGSLTGMSYHFSENAGSTLATPTTSLSGFIATNAASAVTAAVTTTGLNLYVRGTIRANGAGTFTPQLTQVTNSAAAVVQTNSFIRLWVIGTNTVTNVGNWS